MSSNASFVADFFSLLLNPNATDDELNKLIEEAERAEAEAGLPPAGQRAKDVKEALLLISRQKEETTEKELEYYLNEFYDSVEIARMIARHPSIGPYWLAHFLYFLPEDAQANPGLDSHSKHDKWKNCLRNGKPNGAEPSRYGTAQLRGSYISEMRPWRYKLDYWMEHGSAADKRYIVSIEKLDETVIEPFVNDKSAHIRKQIACRGNLSSDLANTISKDKAKTVRQALAENPKCPVDALVALTKDKIDTVRQAALSNKACPEDAIHEAKLAEAVKPAAPVKPLNELNSNELIQLLGDPATDSSTLKDLAGFEQPYVKAGVALHKNCPAEILRELAMDAKTMVKQSVAFNPNTPNEVLQAILDSGDEPCQIGLASNPALTEQQQLKLVQISDDRIRQILADTTELESVWCALRDSSPTVLKKGKAKTWRDALDLLLGPKGKGFYMLQRGPKTRQLFVAKLIARHPRCPDSLKGIYAFYLFDSLAQNPGIALQLLEDPNAVRAEEYADWKLDQWLIDGIAPGHVSNYYLFSDDIKRRRRAVDNWTACISNVQPQVFHDDILMKKRIAERVSNTPFMFEILARDKKETVRELVAKNKACPAEVLALLATDKVAAVKVAARQNKNYKASLVKTAGNQGEPEEYKNKGPKRNRIRMAAEAKSAKILRDLGGDKIMDVRLSVVNNEKTPVDVLTILARDASDEIREAVAKHRKAPIDLLQSLFTDTSDRVRSRALHAVNWRKQQNLETLPYGHKDYDSNNVLYDEPTLAHFYDDECEDIQRQVARCTANTTIQKRIAESGNEKVSVALAENGRLNHKVARILIGAGNRKVLARLYKNTRDEEIYFASLEADQSLVERNSNYFMMGKPHIQAQLIKHPNPKIREQCVYYAEDADLLMSLVRDEDESVRVEVCRNNKLKKQHIEALLEKPTTGVLEELHCQHPRVLAPFIAPLLETASEELRATIARNFGLTSTWEKVLREDAAPLVRIALAENYTGELSEATQAVLRNDSDERVAEAMNEYDPD